jgi:carboxyl-terminal processing protease
VTRAGALLLALLLAVGAYNLGYNSGSSAAGVTGASGAIDLSRFNEVLDLVETRHVGDKTEETLVDACTTLGPDCYLLVVSPIDGSPAKAAGVQSGDRITLVDGLTVDGETLDEAVLRVRGAKGTSVVITILRGDAAPLNLTIIRDVITVPAVEPEMLETSDGSPVGYLRLAEFSEVAGDQFDRALREVVDAGVTRIILDLRDNPGGYLSTALQIASEFIADGVVYIEETSDGERDETSANGGGAATDPTIKVVVLINKGSASASEILAGALRDRGRAVLVGETTFGKGVVQTFIDLKDGSGLKLTIAKWLTPNGTWVNKVGLAPDYPMPAPATPGEGDPALKKALELLK